MIGPHQGKELELMLAGKKNFAMFHDALIEGQEIHETIIPEKAFAPYVQNGTIIRLSEILISPKSPIPGKYVCFTLPGQEWRAQAFFAMSKECLSGKRPFDDVYEFFIGRLLDYSEEDIHDYLRHRKDYRVKMSRRSGT
jgi:hypothetical protein